MISEDRLVGAPYDIMIFKIVRALVADSFRFYKSGENAKSAGWELRMSANIVGYLESKKLDHHITADSLLRMVKEEIKKHY